MSQRFFAGALSASLALTSLTFAHGGTYRGPQDTVPPSGGGGGGGSVPTPGGGMPGVPGPDGRPTGGAVSPGQSGGGAGGGARKTGGPDGGADLSAWQFWWGFNKEPYLNLKSHLAGSVVTGSDQYYLGAGEREQSKDTLRVSEATIRNVIVPRLLAALQQEQSNDIQSSCMIALAKIGEAKGEDGTSEIWERVTTEIKRHLTSSSQELSETAAVALGIMADAANIDLLSALLDNDQARLRGLGVPQIGNVSVRTRAFAAYGLGLIGHKASHEARLKINATLRRILDGEGKSMAQRDIQVACLTSIGLAPLAPAAAEESVEPLGKLRAPQGLDSRQDQLRYLLAYYGDDSNNYLIRAHAPAAMARILNSGESAAGSPLRDLVAKALMQTLSRDSKAQDALQQSAALALGVIGDSDEDPTDVQIRSALMRVKEELADHQVRNFALIALAQAAGRAGEGLGDPLHGVNTKDKQQNARSFLLNELARGKNAVRPWSGLSIAVMERALDDAKQASSAEAKQALGIALSESSSPDEQGAFAIACGIARHLGAKQALIENLGDVRDVEARGYTAVGLGLMNETSAIPLIQEIVRKSKYQAELLKSAAIGLGLLGDRQLVDELLVMLENANGLSSQAAISSALGFIGDSRSVDPLVDMLADQEVTALARAFAAVALGIIADKEDLPWNSKISVNSNYRANTVSLTDRKSGILDIL